MEKTVFQFRSLKSRKLALTCERDGHDLSPVDQWRLVDDIKLNRPKLELAGVPDIETALDLLNNGKPYIYDR